MDFPVKPAEKRDRSKKGSRLILFFSRLKLQKKWPDKQKQIMAHFHGPFFYVICKLKFNKNLQQINFSLFLVIS